ncbi:MAG: EamA family transporter, partial [Anaerolinea sp.]|nr:EamA family transporter [Anaerolinea sp.]
MTTRQLVVLLGLAAVWGASFLFIKVLVEAGLGPAGLSAARTLLGVLTLAPVVWRIRASLPRDRKTWLLLAGLGVLNFALPWTLFAIAAQEAPSGASSIANSSLPLWSAIFATVLLKTDRLTGVRVLGLAAGFSGVLVLMGGGLLDAGSDGSWAILIMLLATMCYGLSGVLIRGRLGHVPGVGLAAGQMAFAAVVLWPVALASGAFSSVSMGAAEWGSLLALGCAGSGVGVAAYMWLIGETGPVRASLVTYLMPPLGVFLGWAVLDEAIGWNLVGGLTLVIAGVALVQGVPLRRLMSRPGVRPA